MQLAHYLGLLCHAEDELGRAFGEVGDAHGDEPDIRHLCARLADECNDHAEQLAGTRSGPLGLLRDLHDLYLMATECDIAWTLVGQAAQGARDRDLLDVVQRCEGETAVQLKWLRTRMRQAAPQALVVAR